MDAGPGTNHPNITRDRDASLSSLPQPPIFGLTLSYVVQVGRSYGRVVVYCSNFESTSADAMFFESFLCLARMVVAAAIAEPFLDAEVKP